MEDKIEFVSNMLVIAAVIAAVEVILFYVCISTYVSYKLSYQANVKKYNALQVRIKSYDKTKDTLLLQDIQKWNIDLAKVKEAQNNMWISCMIPESYKDFKFISYDFLTEPIDN